MVNHTLNLCSAFIHPSAHTAVNIHTHGEHTPGAVGSHLCCGLRGAVGGSVPCSTSSCYWRWREHCTFIHSPTDNPCRPRLELTSFRLWVQLSTIRPWLKYSYIVLYYFAFKIVYNGLTEDGLNLFIFDIKRNWKFATALCIGCGLQWCPISITT